MKFPVAFAALVIMLSVARSGQAQDDGPRQLGAPPSVPVQPRVAVPAPRQLDAAPTPAPDTTRRDAAVPQPGPATAPRPLYAPTPAGQLPGSTNQPTRYQVGIKSGMVYNVTDVETRNPLFGHSFLLLDGQRKVDFNEVSFYEDETGHYVRTTLPGSSRESTVKREKTGRISLYSTTSTSYSPGYGYGGYGSYGGGRYGSPYGGYRTTKTEYFSKDNGPIQDMTIRNLAVATLDNAGAQQLLTDARRYQTYSTAGYVVGGGLLVAGLLQSLSPTATGISPLTFLALPVLIVPVVMQSKQAANQKQAIALYNAGAK